jgi:hypothetical protein
MEPRPTELITSLVLWPALAAAALFFAGAMYAALSAGMLPGLLVQAGQYQPVFFCH